MVDVKESVRSQQAEGSIPIGAAIAPELANIELGQTVSRIGAQTTQMGVAILEANNAYKRAVQEADNTAVYANSINQATIEYQNLFQERINDVVDDEGNPTFSTLQSDVSQIGVDVLDKFLNQIESPQVRAQFINNFQAYTGNQQIGSISIARDQQMSFINESVSNSVAELGTRAGAATQQDRVFFDRQVEQILNSATANGAMTPEQRFSAADSYRKEVATAIIRNEINQDPQAAFDRVSGTPAPELGLTELERLSLQAEAQTALTRHLKAEGALDIEQNNFIRDQLKGFEKIISLGGQIPQDAIDELVAILPGSGFEDQFTKIMNLSGAINEYTTHTPIVREAINNRLNSDESLNIDGLEMRKALRIIGDNLGIKRDTDVYSLAIEQGMIGNPEPFDPNGDIQAQLTERLASLGVVERQYGKRTSGLTKEEINGFQEAYIDAPYQQKASMLGDVIGGLGEHAVNFLEDLAVNGSAQMAAIGSLMLAGDDGGAAKAVTILKGQDILANNKDILPENYRQVKLNAVNKMLPFYDSPQQQQDILSMSDAIYAARTFEEHDFSQIGDRQRMEQAIADVSNGGAINFNGTNIEPAYNGMTANQFKKWIRNITPEQIEQSGGWQGFDSDRIPKLLSKSQLISTGRGNYLVLLESGDGTQRPVLNNKGEGFILDYEVIQGDGREPIEVVSTAQIRKSVDDIFEQFNTLGLRGGK